MITKSRMGEVDSSNLDAKDDSKLGSKFLTPTQEINAALKECGFGWFHWRMMCASYFGISTSITLTHTGPYILPHAECDLNMDLQMKGYLNASVFIGSLLSAIVAGFLVDTFGRKLFLIGGFALMVFFNLVSAMSQTYGMLLFSKFCEGLVFATAYSPTITYTSEYCHDCIRDKIMLVQAAFAPATQILVALISWAILINDWQLNLFGGYIVLNTWNIYLLVTTIFPLIACILYCFLPESPKYLITKNRYKEAREILCYVYRTNTGKPIETFSYANLWEAKIAAKDKEPEHPKVSLRNQLTIGLHSIKPLIRKPHVHYLLLFSIMLFFVLMVFNFFRMWFPQLSTIVEHYATEDNQVLCTMLDAYTHDLRLRSANVTSVETCVPVRSGTETYVNSIILGCACLPPIFLTSLLVNRIGKKSLLIVVGLMDVGVTLGLGWSNSKVLVVALFAAGVAFGQIMRSLLEASTMHFFPTTIRTLALAVIMTIGRIGSLVGNIIFPILLDIRAVIPFYTLTGFMSVVTILAMIYPTKNN